MKFDQSMEIMVHSQNSPLEKKLYYFNRHELGFQLRSAM